jgi:hypothetical protein
VDHDRLRAIAATRPGYATYPDTRPGSPYWLRPRQPSPCTWAVRPGAGLLCVRADHQHHDQAVTAVAPAAAVVEAPASAAVTAVAPPRRRWWQWLTRRRADR